MDQPPSLRYGVAGTRPPRPLQWGMSEQPSLRILLAEVVYNGIGTARQDAAVVIEELAGRRTIVDITDRQSALRVWPEATTHDAGFAISPAPVNAHTHLDLTDMPIVDDSYERFIPTVIEFAGSGRRTLAAAERGTAEILDTGVTTVGDIVTRRDVLTFLLSHPKLNGVAYWEVIGMDPEQADAQLRETEALIREFLPLQRPGGVRLGLTPHTPHTVTDRLMQGLTQLAQQYRLPIQIHVEESPLEKPMFLHGQGELAAVRSSFDPAWQPPGISAIRHLEKLGVLAARPTLVHMVNVDDEEIRLVQKYSCSVVHCPRSNDQLRCGRFPWELYARHGVSVAIGTDSRGSSPSLAVQEEVCHAARLHGDRASAQALVRAAVKGGHQVLGSRTPTLKRGDDAAGLHIWRATGTAQAAS